MRERPRMILDELATTQPAVVLVELFPFGRKKFEFELLPLLDAVHSMGVERPTVVCSVRDILVGRRSNQARHDERAAGLANRYFDAILVHSDPRFARLEDTFRPDNADDRAGSLHGLRHRQRDARSRSHQRDACRRVLVSAGGGMVGGPLFEIVVDAHRRWHDRRA